ncbi:DNA polymerase III subunit chi [Kiloniella sp. b19]|uniref:DNA polymerase III subunit chi n=1 Tax=Kiloniella sp. GXU_MW_B19 TaxID=3141326 RepID=UPI0031DC92A0
MTEVRFYHLTRTALEKALPVMLEKVLEREQTAGVVSTAQAELGNLDDSLWSFRPESFLPHSLLGGKTVGSDDPIVLTTDPAQARERDVLFFLHGASPDAQWAGGLEEGGKPSVMALLFDGHNAIAVQEARVQWKALKALDRLELTYWQQTDRGGWEKKA